MKKGLILMFSLIFVSGLVYAVSSDLQATVEVVELNDSDGDGYIDEIDNINGDINDVETNISLNFYVNGNLGQQFWNTSWDASPLVEFNDSGGVVSFEYDFSDNLDLTSIRIEEWKNSSLGGLVMGGIDLASQNRNKTVFVDRISGEDRLCVLDKEIDAIEDCTTGKIIDCPSIGNYSCQVVMNNTKYKVSGLTHSGVREVLKGDVRHDCVVNIFDLARVGLCYECSEGKQCWQDSGCWKADLSRNDVVGIFDLATVGQNYDKVC